MSPKLDNSLRRLGVDHLDLYQIHRWDPNTSDEETPSALTDLQRAGKIRYFGSSTFPAYRIVQAQWAAREHHLSASEPRHLSLVHPGARGPAGGMNASFAWHRRRCDTKHHEGYV